MITKKFAVLTALVALSLALAACGGGDNKDNAGASSPAAESPATGGEEAAQEVVITATNWAFDQEEYRIPKDTPVKLTLVNGQGAHGIEIEGVDAKLKNGSESAVVTLPAGTYEFRCSIMCGSGHAKMVGKLIVE